MSISRAAFNGDLGEVKRLIEQEPGLLDAPDGRFARGHVGVARWLLDKGAAIDERDYQRRTALWHACREGRSPVVSLLLARGADPTIVDDTYSTTLMAASRRGHLEAVRSLLDHPSVKPGINHRDRWGSKALCDACDYGRGGVAKALLESGADPTIARNDGLTPMAIAKQDPPSYPLGITAEGLQECLTALRVRLDLLGLFCLDELA
jgi:uncharacterized protein